MGKLRGTKSERASLDALYQDDAFLRQISSIPKTRGYVFKVASLLRAYGVTNDYKRAVKLAADLNVYNTALNSTLVETANYVVANQGLSNIFDTGGAGAVYNPNTGQFEYYNDNPLAVAYNKGLPFKIYDISRGRYITVTAQEAYDYMDCFLNTVWNAVYNVFDNYSVDKKDISFLQILIFFDLEYGYKNGKIDLKSVIINLQDSLDTLIQSFANITSLVPVITSVQKYVQKYVKTQVSKTCKFLI